MYERRRDWINHETLLHRREWTCNVAGHPTYHSRETFTEHVYSEHAELAVSSEVSEILSLFERPATTTQAPCPFCLSEDTKGISMTRLEKHMAQHMEALALFALPRSQGGDDEATIDSDAGVEISRGSSSDTKSDVLLSSTGAADSENQGSFEFGDLERFDGLFNRFLQDSNNLSISKHRLEGLEVRKQYEPDAQHLDLRQRVLNILQMTLKAQTHDTVDIRDFLKQLRFRLYTHSKFNEELKRPMALLLTGVIVALAEAFGRLLDTDNPDLDAETVYLYLQNIGQ